MKFYKVYNYTIYPVLLLFFITSIRYFLGNKSIFTSERIIFCLVGGLMLGVFWYLTDWFEMKKKVNEWFISQFTSKIEGK